MLLLFLVLMSDPTPLTYEQVYSRVSAGEKLMVAHGVTPREGEVAGKIDGEPAGVYWCYKEGDRLRYKLIRAAKGSVTVVTATFCVPCKKLKQELKDDPTILNGYKLTLIDDTWDSKYNAYPTVIIYNSDGTERARYIGMTGEKLRELLK